MKKIIAIVFLGFVLTSCVDSYDNPINPGSGQEVITGDDASDKKSFTTKQMTVNDKGKSTKTVSLRYYSDMPHVAYISISDFQNMVMPSKKIKVSRIAASQYSLVTSKGETAKVNTADESMKFDDFMSFVSLNVVNSLGYLGKDDDDPSYVREMPMTYSPTSASVTFNMKKYGINLRGDGKMVYVPLTTLSDIYSDISCTHVFFNGEKILLTDFDEKPATIDATFFQKPFDMAERPADLAAYSYGELCFAIDHFYGRPGRNAIDNDIQGQGLDQTLSQKHRALLKSTKMDEYVFGMEYLGALLDDGGHTHLSPIQGSFYVGMDVKDKLKDLVNKYIYAFATKYPSEAKAALESHQSDEGNKMAAKERQKLLNSDTYVKIGNTMYCFFDDFGPIDAKGWAAYYKGTGSMPTYNPQFKGDICGIVEALDKAAADPEVKNFVLDLTCNNGGEASVLATITNLLAGKSTFPFENVLTKQRGIVTMQVDGNFDRVFDDNDKAPRHPELNIAIMTSKYAFSCGNLLPSLMKDYGFLIIGQKSGGGSCSIQQMCTAEGFCYILSTARVRLVNKVGENIDGGVEPHIALEVKQATAKDDDGDDVKYLDFSAFYTPSVGDQIVNWYANK